jgi:patatin-related protein
MERSLEARLGVVMYGGVSLAVYENGVAQELFRAVRGHEPISGGGQKLGVYDLLKTLTDTDIVVDILSGTSAGGINGILLGYALANAKDFTRCSSLWCEDGDLMGLMRKPRDEAMNSLLDSTGVYQPALQKAFREMDKHDYGKPYGSEIDLFVTGTNVHGHVYTEFDDQGHAIDVKDHRAVFVLSYRPDRKNEFAAENIDALAKLARITSCFPIAFEPVHVSATDAADKALCRWGRLTEDAYFLDGGVLDNKPFSYAIDAIFGRLASRPVERMLLYIEPDPEHLNNEPLHEMPNVLKAATDALVAIPGYESISSDLQTIAARNSKLQKYKEVVRNILDDKEDMLSKLDSESPATKHIYLQARLSQVRDRVLSGLLKQGGQLRLLNESQRRAVRILVTSFDEFGVEGEETLRDFDVYFRLRRLHFLVCYVLQPAIHASIRVDDVYAEVLHRLNHQINLLEMIQFAAESVIDNSSIPADDLLDDRDSKTRAKEKWIAVQNLLRQVLARTDKLSTVGTREWDKSVSDESRIAQERQSRDVFMTELRRRMDELRQSNGLELKSVIGNLLEETDDQERKILERLEPKQGQLFDLSDEERKLRKRIPDAYRHFKHIDAYLFPLEELGNIGCKDQIRTVRISPNDSRFGIGKDKNVKGKLCGRLLGHFAGFLKRSWRVNDIMWGRLDAVS